MGPHGLFCHGAPVHHRKHGSDADVPRAGYRRCPHYALDLADYPAVVAQTLLESSDGDVQDQEILGRRHAAGFGSGTCAGRPVASASQLFPLRHRPDGCRGLQRRDARHRHRRRLYHRTFQRPAGQVHRLAGRFLQHRQGLRHGRTGLSGRRAQGPCRNRAGVDDRDGPLRRHSLPAGAVPHPHAAFGRRRDGPC